MKLQIIKIDKIIFDGTVSKIQAVSPEGHFEILPGHAPLLATLKAGPLIVEEVRDNKCFHHHINLSGGIMKIAPQEAVILAQ